MTKKWEKFYYKGFFFLVISFHIGWLLLAHSTKGCHKGHVSFMDLRRGVGTWASPYLWWWAGRDGAERKPPKKCQKVTVEWPWLKKRCVTFVTFWRHPLGTLPGGTTPIPQGLSQTSRQFYGPETRGRYLGEPVPMAVSR